MASAAQWERRIIGQRTRDALQAKKASGARLGRPVALPRAVRTRIAGARKDGHTLAEIADDLNAENISTAHGGGRWHPETVRAVLRSVALDAA
jgi:DNA invertase Pin-like site-specific DNA recombinase